MKGALLARAEQIDKPHTERFGPPHQVGERRIPASVFEMRDRRCLDPYFRGKVILRQIARLPQARNIAVERPRDRGVAGRKPCIESAAARHAARSAGASKPSHMINRGGAAFDYLEFAEAGGHVLRVSDVSRSPHRSSIFTGSPTSFSTRRRKVPARPLYEIRLADGAAA